MTSLPSPRTFVADQELDLAIEGMTCASCVARVEKALQKVPGVSRASVNLATERATILAPAGTVSTAALEDAVRGIGYEARAITASDEPDDMSEKRDAEASALARSLLIAAVLTLPIFIVEMGSHLIPALHHWVMMTLGPWSNYLQFGLTTLVLFGPGLRYFRKGIPALLRLAPDMNALVAMGAGAAYLYSTIATFLPGWLPATD